MNILFVTHNFPPEVNAAASRTFEHCREWHRLGANVTVLTCAPNWPKGRLFSGYRNRLFQREQIEGVKIIRSWTYLSANSGKFRRALNYISFMISAIGSAFFTEKADVVLATSPQLLAGLAGWVIGKIKHCKFILEIRDLWPDSIVAVGAMKNNWLICIFYFVEKFLYKKAWKIIVVSRAFEQKITERGIDRGKIFYLPNGADMERFHPGLRKNHIREKYLEDDEMLVSYVGTLGMAHGLDIVIRAAKLLRERDCSVKFLLVGDGAERKSLKRQVQKERLGNIIFVDLVSKDKIGEFWRACDISLIHLKKVSLFKTTIPSKLFEAMAHAIPIALGVDGEARKIMESAECGIFFEPENEYQLIEVLLRLKNDRQLAQKLGKLGLAYVRKNFDRKCLAKEFLHIIAN